MIEIFKSTENGLVKTTFIDKGVWINLQNPDEYEIRTVCNALNVDEDFIRAALDEEESARTESDDEHHLIVVDIPYKEIEDERISYETIPLAIIYNELCIVTVCLSESHIIRQFAAGKVKSFFTYKKMRFILLLLYHICTRYLLFLKQINRLSERLEQNATHASSNEELLQLLELQKSLVYFNTSLHANAKVLNKLMRVDYLKKYPEDAELLDDVIIENKQAIEMAQIYTNIMSNTVGTFTNILNNNLNSIMKNLTFITILMGVFTVFSGLYGMNVPLPFQEEIWAFPALFVLIVLIVTFIFFIFKRNRML